jgi:Uma2 family endonuclease
MPAVPNEPYFTLAPDCVCEVLSPSTARTDRSDKLPIYARESVPHVWFVSPLDRTLEVLELEGQRYAILGVWRDSARVRAEPFDAIELDMAPLWADAIPPEP